MRRTSWVGSLIFVFWGCQQQPPVFPVAFGPGFDFGFATVGYQSEGTITFDGGRCQSNWSEWEDLGQVQRKQRNDRGNGFFDHYEEDLDRSRELGATSFSYAIDWARLEPARGQFDERELDRIESIVRAIRDRNMKPMVVLYHWVTPAWVQSPRTGTDLLSQPNDEFVDAFMPVVDVVVPRLAGLVDTWVTFEEPYSIVAGGYLVGEHPPGHLLDITGTTRVLRNLMYLHARTYHRIKELDQTDVDGDGQASFVGFENLAFDVLPVDATSERDVRAAQRVDYILNHQFITGVWKGDIDLDFDGMATSQKTDPPESHDPLLEHTLDFIGLNYYGRARANPGDFAGVPPVYATPHFDVKEYDPSLPHVDNGQEISAAGMRTQIEAYSRYGLPLIVTENGAPDAHDTIRPQYLLEHVTELGKAIRDGYDVRGYYYWTISDNFEWASGIDSREGLFQVDFSDPSYPRTRTRSADLFAILAHAREVTDAVWREWSASGYPISAE